MQFYWLFFDCRLTHQWERLIIPVVCYSLVDSIVKCTHLQKTQFSQCMPREEEEGGQESEGKALQFIPPRRPFSFSSQKTKAFAASLLIPLPPLAHSSPFFHLCFQCRSPHHHTEMSALPLNGLKIGLLSEWQCDQRRVWAAEGDKGT